MLGVRAELLIAHAWLHGLLMLEETVAMLGKAGDAAEGFGRLQAAIKGGITPS